MGGEHDGSTVTIERRPQMLHTVDGDLRGDALQRSPDHEAAFREHHPEVLEGGASDVTAVVGVERGKRQGEIGKSQAPTALQQDPGRVAEPSPEPCRYPDGERGHEGRDESQGYAGPRLRARRISTAIGITERMMTMTTTMWR